MSYLKTAFILFFFIGLIISCKPKQTQWSEQGRKASIEYATGFRMEYFDNYTIIEVGNPWKKADVLHTYVLIDRDKPLPERLPPGVLVAVPVNKIACLYSVDASMIERLDCIDQIHAMAETRYVKIPAIKKGLSAGKIMDIGEATNVNIERLIHVSPEVIFVSPFQNTGYGKLETLGITILENAAYLESSPLGRAEWIRFIGAFLKKDKEAEEIMKEISSRYLELAEKTKHVSKRPSVFGEKKYGQVWWVSGGDSYMAHFFRDAGADYCWKDDTSQGSLGLSFEAVYEKAEHADYWVIKTDRSMTYDDLKKEYDPYSFFDAWKKRNIVVCNSVKTNYYEDGVMNPDLVLADLIHIFHSDLLPDHVNIFFERMSEKIPD